MVESTSQNRFLVHKAYHCSNSNPILLRRGDPVRIGRTYDGDPEWPDWIWCEDAAGRGGWVPKTLIAGDGFTGRAREPYDARELTVEAGETVTVSVILNGWAWVGKSTGEAGWIPFRHLTPHGRRQADRLPSEQ